jgi:poly-gamma-glutamate synthesis protein (capsule biosynthesis protein)
MAPEWNPDMEELNKRRVERHLRRQKVNAQKRRKKQFAMIGMCLLLVAIGMGVFFLLRMGEDSEPEPQLSVQSDGSVKDEDDTVIHLVAAGDVNVTDAIVASGGPEYDYKNTFLDVAHLLAEGDITVVNFEGNLCGGPYGTISGSAPQSLAEMLQKCGVDLMQLANSYSINQGISGLQATIQSVKDAGMEPLGVYGDERSYRSGKGYTIKEVEGVKIAFVAFTKGMNGMTLPQGSENCVNLLYTDYDSTYRNINRKSIHAVMDAVEKESPDLTVAMLHWGSEYNDNVSQSQEDIVALLQERGVDAVIGTHPHFVHKMTYDPETGNFVAYSLGDLISDAARAGTEYSVILNLEITKTGDSTKITGFSYTPIFTVAERGSTLRTVRVAESMTAYDLSHINRVQLTTYDAMDYALGRIEARVKGE